VDDRELTAGQARAQMRGALAPVIALAERFVASGAPCNARQLRYVVQMDPTTVRVTVAPDEGREAWTLHVFNETETPLPVRTALAAAFEDILRFDLTARGDGAVAYASAIASAQAAGGGPYVVLDPSTGTVALCVTERDLGEGVVLLSLVDATERSH
jgi:hypothetical protein